MTADEKALVERLDRNAKIVRERNSNPPILTVLSEEAAALICRQSEEIDKLARALESAYWRLDDHNQAHIKTVHAAALAIAKERA